MDPITPAGDNSSTPATEPKADAPTAPAPAPSAPAAPEAPATPPPVATPPAPAAPTPVQTAAPQGENPGKTLGIIAFVLSLLGGGLISLILGIIAKSKSKKAGMKNGLALAAIIISVIGMIVGTLLLVMFLMTAGSLVQHCAELGPGIHLLENGATLNCN